MRFVKKIYLVLKCIQSVAYLGGGPRCDGWTMKIFYRRLYMNRCVFCHFPARIAKLNNVWWSFAFPNFRKMGEFAVSIEHLEAKSVSASGGLRTPDHPTRGSAPGPRWGLRPQTPVIGSRSTRSPCQILNTPLHPVTGAPHWIRHCLTSVQVWIQGEYVTEYRHNVVTPWGYAVVWWRDVMRQGRCKTLSGTPHTPCRCPAHPLNDESSLRLSAVHYCPDQWYPLSLEYVTQWSRRTWRTDEATENAVRGMEKPMFKANFWVVGFLGFQVFKGLRVFFYRLFLILCSMKTVHKNTTQEWHLKHSPLHIHIVLYEL